MRALRSLIAASALLVSVPAFGQSGIQYFPQTIPSGTFVGRLSSGPGPTEAISTTALLNALFPNGSAAFPFNAASVAFQGSVSGTVTVLAQAAAGTWSLKWPTSQGTTNQCLKTTASGSIATTSWANCAFLDTNNTWSGTQTFNGNLTVASLANFTGTFQRNGTTQTFPASGVIVGTSDSQTLTNKSIDAGQLTGTIAAGRLPAGTYAQTVNTFTADHTIATTDCGNIVQMGTGSTGKLTSTLPAVAGFTAPCPVTIVNGDTARGKMMSGYPTPCFNNTLNGSNGILFPGQSETVAIVNGAWATINCPGRWRPTSAVTFTIDTGGSDTTGDGLGAAGATSLRSIGQCVLLVTTALDYSSALGQPTCAPTTGQTYTESITLATPYVGTNTLNIAGNGGQFTWKPSGANPFVILVGNYANLQLANVIISGSGATCATTCTLISLHNVAIFETLANVTCDNTGSSGSCVKTDPNTAGGGRINIDSGMTLTGTVGTVLQTNSGTTSFWSSTLIASGSPSVAQIFQAIGAGSNIFIAGNFATSGAFGAARQWAILNSAVLCNVSGVAVPGSTAGISTSAGFAAGVIVNSGVSAGGC